MEDGGSENGEGGSVRIMKSEQLPRPNLSILSEGCEVVEREEEPEADGERLKTPSPATGWFTITHKPMHAHTYAHTHARVCTRTCMHTHTHAHTNTHTHSNSHAHTHTHTGQLRVEGEEGTNGFLTKTDGSVSPSSSRKVIREKKKSIFKRTSKSRVNPSDYSPKPSPKHQPDNISEKSDDRCESPVPEDKERGGKHVKKMKSFKKVAMTMKFGKRFIRGGSSSEDTDTSSLGPSEAGEDEERENGENGEESVDGRRGDVIPEESEQDLSTESSTKTASKRPESLSAPPKGAGGVKLKKGSRSFRQDKQRFHNAMTPCEATKRSYMRNFERRISAPGQFEVSGGTSAAQARNLPNDSPSDVPLTPIVEVTNSEVDPSNVVGDSVFSTEEDVFAVQGIKCCAWGQWMCVMNAGGHVMAFSFQMDNNVTTPKVHAKHGRGG